MPRLTSGKLATDHRWRYPRPHRTFAIACCFLLLALTLFSAVLLRHAHAQAIAAAQDLTHGAAAALSEPVTRGLHSVDRLLLEVAAQPLSSGPGTGGAGAGSGLADRIRDFHPVRALLVTDATGTVVRSSAERFLGVRLGDRKWLASLAQGGPVPLVGEADVPRAPQLLPVAERLPANAGAVIPRRFLLACSVVG
jgi:hypothetical protein